MIKFDSSKVSFQIVQLKSITTALGGSMMVIDHFTDAGKEVLRRIPVPLSVARDFIMRYAKITKYLKPVYVSVADYDGHTICMERHPLGSFGELEVESVDGTMRQWEPDMNVHFDKVARAIEASSNDWYFDGRYIYTFAQNDLDTTLEHGQVLSGDGKFRKVPAQSFDTQSLHHKNALNMEERSCLGFISSTGDHIISPPIWKNLDDVGGSKLAVENSSGMVDDDSGLAIGKFDSIDNTLSVNLNFALKAASEVGQVFGYETIEPLQLPRLMIELTTVNLPNVSKEIKATYCIGMKFTHTIAWLLGLQRRSDDLNTMIMVRSLLKYLTKRGIFRTNILDAGTIFRDGKTAKDVMAIDTAEEGLDETLGRTLRDIVLNAKPIKPHLKPKALPLAA